MRPTFEELQNRIGWHLGSTNDPAKLREIAIAWDGYIAALMEWGLISVDVHSRLFDLLPSRSESPVREILLGVPGQYDLGSE